MSASLQEGIYHGPGQRPGAFFDIVFLRVERGTTAGALAALLGDLWSMYQGLKQGRVADLPGHPVPADNLTVLLSYGVKAFDLAGARRPAPASLGPEFRFRSPRPGGGGPLLVNAGLHYAADVALNPATEELAVQFIADSALAVHRAVVETWKVLRGHVDPQLGVPPLEIAAAFSGFQRNDGRSWIDFHDGVSNLRSQDRELVIGIKPENAPLDQDAWVVGGTHLAFVRLSVDLAVWRGLTPAQQELAVGRAKLTGSPLRSRDDDGNPLPDPRCPVAGTREVVEPGNEAFREPETSADEQVGRSHVQRANRHVPNIGSANSLRVFRQGYEFLESPPGGGFRVGLNFVSFQDSPERLTRMLTAKDWLGGTNFGGTPGDLPGMDRLLGVRAAGIYLVPPVTDGEDFPGQRILVG